MKIEYTSILPYKIIQPVAPKTPFITRHPNSTPGFSHLRGASSTMVWRERPAGFAPSPSTEDQEEEVKRNNRCTLRTPRHQEFNTQITRIFFVHRVDLTSHKCSLLNGSMCSLIGYFLEGFSASLLGLLDYRSLA